MRVLVINSGSSTIKFCLYDMKQEILLVSGRAERIGEDYGNSVFHEHTATGDIKVHKENSQVIDHTAGLKQIIAFLESSSGLIDLMTSLHAIGHRIVHGGESFQPPYTY